MNPGKEHELEELFAKGYWQSREITGDNGMNVKFPSAVTISSFSFLTFQESFQL